MNRPVPVLMYHHISPHRGDTVTVTPYVFDEQMAHLRNRGIRTLRLEELLALILGDLTVQEKAVAVTFDDGWLDNYHYAFPVLKKHNVNAAVFVVTDRVERATRMIPADGQSRVPTHKEAKDFLKKGEDFRVSLNWAHLSDMTGSGVVDVYSHTKSHARCDELSADDVRTELAGSKDLIERRLGRDCPFLCWPNGAYNKETVAIAMETGYEALFTTRHGVAEKGADPFAISRIVVKDGVSWFRKRMSVYTHPFLSRLYLALKGKGKADTC